MRTTRLGVCAAMVLAASLVTVGGTMAAEPVPFGTAAEADKHGNKHDAQSKQDTAGQHSEQPNATDQSANQQGKHQEKPSQADLDQGKSAKAVEELEQQKPTN